MEKVYLTLSNLQVQKLVVDPNPRKGKSSLFVVGSTRSGFIARALNTDVSLRRQQPRAFMKFHSTLEEAVKAIESYESK